MAKQTYMGLRGERLIIAMITTEVFPAYFLLGYNNSVMGGLLSLESFATQFPQADTLNTSGKQIAHNSLGCMIGALCCYKIGDRFGRLRIIAAGAILSIIGSILLSSSFSLAQFIVGRVILGCGMGFMSATVPVWQAESSPAERRGALMVLEGAFVTVGLFVSQFVDLGLFFAQGSVSWRFPLALPIVPLIMILGCLPFFPDSPRWLVKVGRIEEARNLLAVLADVDISSPVIEEDIYKIRRSLDVMSQGKFADLLRNGDDRLLNRTLLALFSTFSQQVNGIGVVGSYTADIFIQFIGLSAIQARILSGSLYVWQLLCCSVTFHAIDRMGRRALMIIGVSGIGTMTAILAGMVSNPDNKACSIIATIAVFLLATFFGVGALGVNYLYGTEVAPLAYRAPVYALSTTTLWSFNFLVVEVIYFFLPETRKISLEDVDAIFRNAKDPFEVVRIARSMSSTYTGTSHAENYEISVENGPKNPEDG
ncbi:MFS sugar transporter [Penicillium riverlandense]|uniref:MFS sugar transporter n=1 Tax=Penicillium riverlandense TaxID=1903569 RepID=UPI002548D04B|nr:MFS sugar transporter [Penicillium riverlandense]KAJ5825436.1 MFS sugar transporter [Penicillium riverlandense]